MKLYKTEGIIIKKNNFKETDLILTILTRDHGKVSIIAKGARKTHSKFIGTLELFSDIEFMASVGKNLDILSQAKVLRYFNNIRQDLFYTGIGFYICELSDKTLPERESNYKIFLLLKKTFDILNKTKKPILVLNYFEVNLMRMTGFVPNFKKCGNCSKEFKKEKGYFSKDGGVLCQNCRKSFFVKFEISERGLKLLKILEEGNLNLISRLRVDNLVLVEVRKILDAFLNYFLDKKLKSKKFLKLVEK